MAALNPIQLLGLLQSGNAKEFVTQIVQQNYSNNPTILQLLQYVEKGDVASIENYARNYFAQQGSNYDDEMKKFLSMMKGIK